MPIYNIGYGSCEENEYTPFEFDRKLTRKELSDYVHRATINALKYAIDHKDDFYWVDGKGITFQNLYPRVKKELKLFGFKPLKFEGEWNCFGWASICNNDDWPDYRDSSLSKLVDSVPKELKERAIGISNEIFEEIKLR